MALLSLSCPLCCKEKFSSHISLKYHLLSMIDNLLCPSCNERCDDLMDMADHLGRECKNLEKSGNDKQNDKKENTIGFEEMSAQEEAENTQGTPEINKESEEPLKEPIVKKEVLDSSLEDSETGNKIIDIDESGNVNENTDEQTGSVDNETNMMYTCEMCNISFSSVEEHLATYHEGEEVLLETEQDENVDISGEEGTLLEYQGSTEEDDIFEEDGSTREDSERPESQLSQTGDEILVDKTGMNYTRKVVKVDADWAENQEQHETDKDEVNQEEIEPITTKYIVEEGKVRKLTEEEVTKITDQSTIIEVHICPNCNLQFPNMSHFKKHNCKNAKPIFSKRRDKKEKLLKIKEELRYQCTFCLAIYNSLIALNDHMKAHLIQDESGMVQKKTITMTLHVCDICNTKFPTYKQLRLHSRMHEPIKDKQVDPPVSYNIMGQSNDENEEANSRRETFECLICNKLIDKEYEEVHLKSHESQENVVCLVCNRKFDTRENLDMHMKAHSSTKKFACSYCKKPFNNYTALEDHVLNQCQKRQYECQYCGRRFGRPHEKVKHERIHTGEKPHVCQVCGRAFRVSYCLTLHMRTHTNTRPYICTHCGKRFKSHSVYNHHIQTHSEERNYKCPFCPKAFKTAVQLAGHKNSHTKPFSCNECNRPFASLYAVRAHMETHKRDNNLKYDCWICGASYARSFALRDHMTAAHGQTSVSDKEQDDNIFVELKSTDDTQMEQIETAAEEHHQEGDERQMLIEGAEYHMAGNDDEGCQVLDEEGGSEGYVVLQEEESNEHIEDVHMEVMEA